MVSGASHGSKVHDSLFKPRPKRLSLLPNLRLDTVVLNGVGENESDVSHHFL